MSSMSASCSNIHSAIQGGGIQRLRNKVKADIEPMEYIQEE